MPFRFQRLPELAEVVLVEPVVFMDERGFFMETFKASAFTDAGIPAQFVQDNHARSSYGVLRGLHYQVAPKPQGKLVRAISGEIFDVAVDIRRDSPTFRRWVAVRLTAANRLMLYVPPGFAHGYCVLSETAEVLYKSTCEYDPYLERGIIWNDPELSIAWPIERPHLSPRDAALPLLADIGSDF